MTPSRPQAWILAGLAAMSAGMVTAQPTPQPEPSSAISGDTRRVRESADRLLFEDATVEQRVEVEAALRNGPSDPLGGEILSRLAQGRPLPTWAADTAVSASAAWRDDDAAAGSAALAGLRTRPAADALLAMSQRFGASARAISFAGLSDLTGRDDLPADHAAWAALLESARLWSDERWFRTLAGWQADRAARLAQNGSQASSRLLETLRQVHLVTPAPERSRLLATLLIDPLEEVRILGIDLALRELASGGTFGTEVAGAAVRLLSDPSEAIRTAAAVLLLQLSPPGAAEVAAAALTREKSPKAAAALLRLAAKIADPGAWRGTVDQALAWLENPAGTPTGATPTTEQIRAARDAATDLAWQLTRRGIMNDEADRLRVRRVLRAVPLAELSPGGCQLTGLLGDSGDVARVATLLNSADAAQRFAAAETVVVWPEHLDAILAAADDDARLVEVAVRGVQLHRQTAAGFLGIDRATTNRPELRRAALTAVADVLPANEVLGTIDALVADPTMKEAVLSTFAKRDRIMSERASPDRAAAITDGLERLARVRLRLDKPAEAVAALDALNELGPLAPPPDDLVVARLRAAAFIRLGRLDDAEEAASDAEGWIEGLNAIIDKPFAARVLEYIDTAFIGTMTEDQFASLELLRRRVNAAVARREPPPSSPIDDEGDPR
jgi:hypothetical protein